MVHVQASEAEIVEILVSLASRLREWKASAGQTDRVYPFLQLARFVKMVVQEFATSLSTSPESGLSLYMCNSLQNEATNAINSLSGVTHPITQPESIVRALSSGSVVVKNANRVCWLLLGGG